MPRLDYAIDVGGHKVSVMFKCPGCGRIHAIYTQDTPSVHVGPRWTFNGDYDRPVLNPSLSVTYPHYSAKRQEESRSFYAKHERYPSLAELPYDVTDVCHSYVGCNGAQPGEITFLADCTHHLKGQTVPLPEIDPDTFWE